MVDLLQVGLVVLAALSLTWAILTTVVGKRKELGSSLQTFRKQTIERLNQKNTNARGLVFMMVLAVILGAGIEYYLPTITGAIILGMFVTWFVITAIIFANPVVKPEPLMTKSQVEKLLEERLKEKSTPSG